MEEDLLKEILEDENSRRIFRDAYSIDSPTGSNDASTESEAQKSVKQKELQKLIVGLAQETFLFSQILTRFETQGLDKQLGEDYESLRIVKKRLANLLKEHCASFMSLTGEKVDNDLMDVVDAVQVEGMEGGIIVETIEPAVIYDGTVIHRGKVIVSSKGKSGESSA